MKRNYILTAILAITLVTMACGIQIDIPINTRLKTGPTVTDEIFVPNLKASQEAANISVSIGAGELKLSPGAEKGLVSGQVTYNVQDFKPEVKIDGNDIQIEQGDLKIESIPSFKGDVKNEWDLMLGTAPMNLRVNAGAYKGEFELGGLSLKDLEVSDGASDVVLSFSAPNKTEMDTLRYNTGASKVTMSGLAYANADTIVFRSGAGDYTLDFSGDLKRDVNVTIESAVSSVTLIVPEGVSARVTFDGGLSNVVERGEWQKDGGDYILNGDGPTIKIIVTMGAGSLELRN